MQIQDQSVKDSHRPDRKLCCMFLLVEVYMYITLMYKHMYSMDAHCSTLMLMSWVNQIQCRRPLYDGDQGFELSSLWLFPHMQ